MIGLTLFVLSQFFTIGFAQSGSMQDWALQIRNEGLPGEIIDKEIGNKRPSNVLIPDRFLPPQTQVLPAQPTPTPAPAPIPSNPSQQGPKPSTPSSTPRPSTQPVPQPSPPQSIPRPSTQPAPQPSTPEPISGPPTQPAPQPSTQPSTPQSTPRPSTQPAPQPSTPQSTPRPPTQPASQPSTPTTPAATPATNEALSPSQRPVTSEPISTVPTQPAPQSSTPTTPTPAPATGEALLPSQRPVTSEPIFTTPTQPSTPAPLNPTPNEALLPFQRQVTSEQVFTAPQVPNVPQSVFLPSLKPAAPNAPVIQQQFITGRGLQPQPQPIVTVSKNPQQVSIVKQAPAPVVSKKGQEEISLFIVPDKCTKLEDLLQNTKELSILAEALEATKLDTSNAKENTVFAPTNEAFQQLAKQLNTNVQELLQDPKLSSILLYHFVPGKLLKLGDLTNGQKLSTGLKDQSLEVEKKSGDNVVNIKGAQSTAKVTKGNVKACDTIIHIIDTVLLPKL